jgi:uncharacterized membrane protein
MMFGWWGFGAVMMVICIILMGRMMMGHGPSSEHGRLSQGESAAPEDRLAERLASGEIDVDEYERRLEALRSTDRSAHT